MAILDGMIDGEQGTGAAIAALAWKYLWWDVIEVPEDQTRAVAQIMNLGTYDDLRQLEALLSKAELTAVLRRAQPGWFSEPSWGFWTGRLALDADLNFPARPPRRIFGDADVA